jgi:hypothetical protein
MMSCSDSPFPTGRRIAYSDIRSPLTLDHVIGQASPMGFPALPSATGELVIINLIAQHDPQPDPQLATGCDGRFSKTLLCQLQGVEPCQFYQDVRHVAPLRNTGNAASHCLVWSTRPSAVFCRSTSPRESPPLATALPSTCTTLRMITAVLTTHGWKNLRFLSLLVASEMNLGPSSCGFVCLRPITMDMLNSDT